MIDGIKSTNANAKPPKPDAVKQTLKGLHIRKNFLGGFDINGSIHRYSNNGGSNADDFRYTDIVEATHNLSKELSLDPIATRITRVEVGVNIAVDDVEGVIDSVLLYKSDVGTFDKLGRRFSFFDYTIKIYAKAPKVLRVEIAIKKKRFLQRNSIYINTLDELIEPNALEQLRHLLIKVFQDVTIIYLPEEKIAQLSIKDLLKYKDYSNPRYWGRLNRTNKRKFQRERAKCRTFIESVGGVDFKQVLSNKIEIKSRELLNFSELNMDYILNKTAYSEKAKVSRMHSIDYMQALYSLPILINASNSTVGTVINFPILHNLENLIKGSQRIFLQVA